MCLDEKKIEMNLPVLKYDCINSIKPNQSCNHNLVKIKMSNAYKCMHVPTHTDTPVAVASSSSTQSAPVVKSIVTTAPSSSYVTPPPPTPPSLSQPNIMQTIPPLKQKTGIIKSKVPPPVPPRGSPRVDRRSSAGGGSHKSAGPSPRGATPSSGEQNYLNDKYFNTIQPNPNNMCRLSPQKLYKKDSERVSSPSSSSRTPIFRERSPTCVRDWLQVNDFAASDYDESVLQFKITEPQKCVTIKPRKPLPFRTAHLQRQSSFRAFSHDSDTSVRYKIENYVKQNEILTNQKTTATVNDSINDTDHIGVNIVSDRIKVYDCNQNAINNSDQSNDSKNTDSPTVVEHPESMDIKSTIEKGIIFKLRKTFENELSTSMVTQLSTSLVQPLTQPKPSAPTTLSTVKPSLPPPIKPRTKYNTKSTHYVVNNNESATPIATDNILNTLKRKQPSTFDKHVIDENDNIKKSEILKSHSKIQSVENVQYLDAFSLDGEFV